MKRDVGGGGVVICWHIFGDWNLFKGGWVIFVGGWEIFGKIKKISGGGVEKFSVGWGWKNFGGFEKFSGGVEKFSGEEG